LSGRSKSLEKWRGVQCFLNDNGVWFSRVGRLGGRFFLLGQWIAEGMWWMAGGVFDGGWHLIGDFSTLLFTTCLEGGDLSRARPAVLWKKI